MSAGWGRWVTKAPLPSPRSEVAVAELHGRVFVVGGYVPGTKASLINQAYDPATDTWEERSSLRSRYGFGSGASGSPEGSSAPIVRLAWPGYDPTSTRGAERQVPNRAADALPARRRTDCVARFFPDELAGLVGLLEGRR
jgi:hypothetical protein